MKRAITAVICSITVVAISLAALSLYHKSPVAVTKTVVVAHTKPVEKAYHVGDTQGGITLAAIYAPATPFTAMDEVDPSQSVLVAVEVSGNVSHENLLDQALIYTSDGQYLKPQGGNVKECSNCAVFILPKNALADTFIYKDFKWYL